MSTVAPTGPSEQHLERNDNDLTAAVAAVLAPLSAKGWAPTISAMRRLPGGASRETWGLAAVLHPGAEPRRLILQRVLPGAAFSGPTILDEDRLIESARQAGVPVPAVVVGAHDCARLLGAACITTFIEGETLGPRIVRSERFASARSVLAGQCGAALAAIHAIDVGSVEGLEEVDPIARLREGLDELGEARPAFEIALRWLVANRLPRPRRTVVHGDFRVGNLLVDESGLRAVLDWELAHLGDPLEDLGWLCLRAWRFGGAGEVGGIGPLADLLDTYAPASGATVDPRHVHWWVVAGTLRWGLICAVQARRHLDGHVRSVELAAIGRRVVESEYDLCQLLGVGVPAPSPPVTDTSPGPEPRHIERPTAADLLDAVRGHLSDQVAPVLAGLASGESGSDGRAGFQLKVAVNALALVEREVRLGPSTMERAAGHLARLGMDDERALAEALRDGRRDGGDDETADAVRALVVDRLRIANPSWLQAPDLAPSSRPLALQPAKDQEPPSR